MKDPFYGVRSSKRAETRFIYPTVAHRSPATILLEPFSVGVNAFQPCFDMP